MADDPAWVPVRGLGHVQAMPMDDRVFRELIGETDAGPLASPQADDWAQVRTRKYLQRVYRSLEHAAGEPPHSGGRARKDAHFVGCRSQDEFDVGHEPAR